MGIIEKMRLDGKKGFVTGGARGIGKCTATAFAEAGADVAIVDLDYAEAVKTAKELADKTGRKVIAIETDCTVPEQVDAMVAKVVEELGGLDFCHNNAGICINVPAEEMTYIRLSMADEDTGYGSKAESDSIGNQRMLINRFLDNHPELSHCCLLYTSHRHAALFLSSPFPLLPRSGKDEH